MKKEAKKSRLLKNSLKSTDYFTPQTRRAPLLPIFNNLFSHADVCLAQGPRLKKPLICYAVFQMSFLGPR